MPRALQWRTGQDGPGPALLGITPVSEHWERGPRAKAPGHPIPASPLSFSRFSFLCHRPRLVRKSQDASPPVTEWAVELWGSQTPAPRLDRALLNARQSKRGAEDPGRIL